MLLLCSALVYVESTCLACFSILRPNLAPQVNTIRVYNLDPTSNHDECASIFNAAGIYMILDVNSPLANGALDRTAPWDSYNDDYMQRVFGVIEAFKEFPNTLAFFAGNEVINEQSVLQVPAYIRVCRS